MAAFATFPTLIPGFQEEWGLSNTEAGWISGIYFGGYVAAVTILTALTDRVDPKRVYLSSMAISALSAAGFAIAASGVWTASFWRLMQGIGLAGTYMPGLKALTDALPKRLQSRAVAFYTASFGIGASLSIYLSGKLDAAMGWQSAFGLCALGPLTGFVLAAIVLKARPPRDDKPTTRLLDLRPALTNRRALGFTIAYSAHNVELFGFRSWLVVFLAFSQAHQIPGTVGAAWSAATIAAVVNLFGLPSSVITNEIAQRFGRYSTLVFVMTLSALTAIVLGFSGTAPFWVVLVIVGVYGVTTTADSATITAGVVAAAEPRYLGTTMAMHSLIGFMGGFVGPIVFGIVLDLAGGKMVGHAWGLAFTVMAVIVMMGLLAFMRIGRDLKPQV